MAGVGVNVQNVAPSICLQQILDRIQPSTSPITPAEMMAQVLNQLERMIDCVLGPQATHGLDWLMNLYMRCWIHGNKRILVQTPSVAQGGVPRACIIIGLDAFGYLRVRDVQNGAEYTLHPDGNSMDMMRGLICPK
ncbi:unnamed protein product [Echinostoma caproni]|uniref:BPL/LPL catalytic domain-containing protein n=1 Tax=Echinostoma caproni TaxID=27848 RepID=A0A182ZZV1_9TREM|nr:unnamed protein product [Echinostoma caproni]